MSFIILFVFVFLKLKGSERAMDTLNTKLETQIVKSSVVDTPSAETPSTNFNCCLVAFL